MRKLIFTFIVSLSLVIGLTGCSQLYNNTEEVSLEDAGVFMDYQTGTVIDVQYVRIRDTGVGAGIGGVLGGILGSFVGEGKANTLATVLGALGGAYVGYKADTANAQELLVRMDDGTKAVIVVRGTEFKPGDKIRVVFRGDKVVRVAKVGSSAQR